MNVETSSGNTLLPEDYFLSRCGSCGREGTVTDEHEIGQLCEPCTAMWSQLSALAFCNCSAIGGFHSLSCTVRIRDLTT